MDALQRTKAEQQQRAESARLLSEVIARSAAAMAVLASGKDLSDIDRMHLRGSADQLAHVLKK